MDELGEIKRDYESKRLEHIKEDLAAFIKNHKQDIITFQNDKVVKDKLGNVSEEIAIKLFIQKSRSINPKREIMEQLEEIQKEKWIRGVQLGKAPDPQDVAKDWATRYSPGWRDHRVMCIIYVFEREKEHFLNLLK